MAELPEITQVFDADVSPYISAMEEMIEMSKNFVRELDDVMDKIDQLHAKLDELPDEVVIRVRYEQVGDPGDHIQNVQQIQKVTENIDTSGLDDVVDSQKDVADAASNMGSSARDAAEDMSFADAQAELLGEHLGDL